MSDFLIGKTNIEGRSFVKKQWFYLNPGDNYYRILPPVHSLAQTGKVAQFYAFHSGFRNSQGYVRMFQCVEEIDRERKMIVQHCPVCDMVRERKKQYEVAKGQPNVSKEQLDKLLYEYIRPFEVQKKYFLNVVNQNNEIGILSVPYKLFTSLRVFLKEKIDQGVDPTGGRGFFLKFTKTQQFKGDRDTTYSVDIAYEQDPANPGSFRYKKHDLTPDFIEQMKHQTADLGTLYKALSVADLSQLVSVDAAEQPALIDRWFGRPETKEDANGNVLTSSVPHTTAREVSRVEVTSDGISVQKPDLPVQNNYTQDNGHNGSSVSAPQLNDVLPVMKSAPSPSAPAVASTTLSDEDFLAKFLPK